MNRGIYYLGFSKKNSYDRLNLRDETDKQKFLFFLALLLIQSLLTVAIGYSGLS